MTTEEIIKFPRTKHVKGSRLQKDDYDLETIPWSELEDKHLIVEEKIDGANCGVSFDSDGNLLLQSRGHFLRGGPREKQFELLKKWANEHSETFIDVLSDRYIMYGEWMAAKHTVFYDLLPSYFMEFDIYDKREKLFLDTVNRNELVNEMQRNMNLEQVHVLHSGKVHGGLKELKAMIGRSHFISDDRDVNLDLAAERAGVTDVRSHTDMSTDMEGLYIKVEHAGRVVERCKFVRSSFTNSILEQAQHWHDRPIVQNRLRPMNLATGDWGGELDMFERRINVVDPGPGETVDIEW